MARLLMVFLLQENEHYNIHFYNQLNCFLQLSALSVLLPVSICLIEALLVVGGIQEVALYDPNDPNTFVVGLRRIKSHQMTTSPDNGINKERRRRRNSP